MNTKLTLNHAPKSRYSYFNNYINLLKTEDSNNIKSDLRPHYRSQRQSCSDSSGVVKYYIMLFLVYLRNSRNQFEIIMTNKKIGNSMNINTKKFPYIVII